MANNFLFVGYAIPQADFDAVTEHDLNPQVQTSKLNWRIIEGLEFASLSAVDIMAVAPASDFPANPKIIFSGRNWAHVDGASDVIIPFVNLFLLKHISRLFFVIFSMIPWAWRARNSLEKHILIYSMHSPFIYAAIIVKLLFNIKVTLLIPDMPAFMVVGAKMGFFRKVAKKIDSAMMLISLKFMSGLIVLTKQAGDAIGPPAMPKLVMEGMMSVNEMPVSLPSPSVPKIAMYSGALVGLEMLLDSFAFIEDQSIRLYITGRGVMLQDVLDASAKDSRISYLGFLSSVELMERMVEASFFISPRSSLTPFIEYSFPSKLLEYMATGRPVLSTILPGIPDEYFEYLHLVPEETPECLAAKIIELSNQSPIELAIFGERARNFVVNRKNNIYQGRRILDFMRSI